MTHRPIKTPEQICEHINSLLPKWRAWFPSEDSSVEITRRELLTLIDELATLRQRAESAERNGDELRDLFTQSMRVCDQLTADLAAARAEKAELAKLLPVEKIDADIDPREWLDWQRILELLHGDAKCEHERLNEDGICRSCGADCRGVGQ